MTIYVVMEFHQGGYQEILGAFSTYEKAIEMKEKDYNCWRNGTRKIFATTLDKGEDEK